MTKYLRLQKLREQSPGCKRDHYDEALPWCLNQRGVLLHRPKEIYVVIAPSGERRHEVVNFYCENCTCDTGNVIYIDEPNAGMVVCRRCEAAAIAAGLKSSSEIAGRHVHIGGVKPVADCCGELPRRGPDED